MSIVIVKLIRCLNNRCIVHLQETPVSLDQETFQLLKDSVQRFVRERLMPAEDHVEEHDEVPPEIVADMKELKVRGTPGFFVNGTPLTDFGAPQLKALVELELKKAGAP